MSKPSPLLDLLKLYYMCHLWTMDHSESSFFLALHHSTHLYHHENIVLLSSMLKAPLTNFSLWSLCFSTIFVDFVLDFNLSV